MEDILEELRIFTREGESSSFEETKKDLSGLSEAEKSIFKLISDEPCHIDKIASKASVGVPQALTMLLSLELKGFVKQLSGKMFVRA